MKKNGEHVRASSLSFQQGKVAVEGGREQCLLSFTKHQLTPIGPSDTHEQGCWMFMLVAWASLLVLLCHIHNRKYNTVSQWALNCLLTEKLLKSEKLKFRHKTSTNYSQNKPIGSHILTVLCGGFEKRFRLRQIRRAMSEELESRRSPSKLVLVVRLYFTFDYGSTLH